MRQTTPRRRPRSSLILAVGLLLVGCRDLGGTSIELGVGYQFVDEETTSAGGLHHDGLYTSEADAYPSVWIAIHQQLTPQRVVVIRERPYAPVLMPQAVEPVAPLLPVDPPHEHDDEPELEPEPEVGEIPEHENEPTLVLPFIGEIMVRIPQGDWKMAVALSMIVTASGFFLWVLRLGRKKNRA